MGVPSAACHNDRVELLNQVLERAIVRAIVEEYEGTYTEWLTG